MAWFPTVEWFNEFRDAINSNEDYADSAEGWGETHNGGFLFHVYNLPTDEHTISELPAELLPLRSIPKEVWDDVPEDVERRLLTENGDDPIYDVLPRIDDETRERLPDHLHEVLTEAEELFERDPVYDDVPEHLSDDLRATLPDHLSSLLYQLEEFVDDVGNVYAYLGLEDGVCTEADVLRDPTTKEDEIGFELAGTYDEWERFVRNDTNIIETVIRGRLQPEGDMTRLLEYSDSFVDLGETVGDVDTDYIFQGRVDDV